LVLFGFNVPPTDIMPTTQVNELKENKDRKKFLTDIGYSESRNDYTKVNKYGFLGRYQFSRSTLKLLGIIVSKEEFLENPQLQEDAMFLLLIANKKNLRRYIKKYSNMTIKGISVSESGILASALKSNGKETKKDALGTSIESYMKRFGGYELNLPGTVKI